MNSRHLRCLARSLAGGLVAWLALVPALSAAQPLTPEELSSVEQACRRGQADLCSALATMYSLGKRVPMDLSRAALFAERGCKNGSESACSLQPRIAKLQGVDKQLAEESAKQDASLTKAMALCNAGEVEPCVMAAFFSNMFVEDKTTEARFNLYLDKALALDGAKACATSEALYRESPPQIQAIYDSRHFIQKTCEKACEAKSWEACELLGDFNRDGTSMPVDRARAFSFYSKACDGGLLRSCGGVGLAYLRKEASPLDMPRVLRLLRQGCEAENSNACVGLGGLYFNADEGVPRDMGKALELFQRACQLGHEPACGYAEELTAKRPSPSPAHPPESDGTRPIQPLVIELFERRCNEGSGGDCLELARVFSEGKRVPKDVSRALGYATQGCKQHHPEACSLQGKLQQPAAPGSPAKR